MTDYLMIWDEETEIWTYYVDDYDEPQEDNIDLYIVTVNNTTGIIIDDTWEKSRIGKVFTEVYDVNLWKAKVSLNHV